MQSIKIGFIVVLFSPIAVLSLSCSRYPSNTVAAKSPVDENFVLSINGHPETYILGQEYNISLQAYNGYRFIGFILALENDNGDIIHGEDLGRFELIDHAETRYSPSCINLVESTNTNPKTRVDVSWVAPLQHESGCVLIRATVLQHRDVWFMDDGGLTKRICEELTDDVESQALAIDSNECCACDEARYELTFKGVWSRNLHPKDFPAKGWTTSFSDLVGAAHTNDYRFWQYGELASKALQELAEHGSTRLIEEELNENFAKNKIRTIIKARGKTFPNLNGETIASIRVDPLHHLVSVVSKIKPSPDWIVGVSGLELCMKNCTWLEQTNINLYPWDVGTDAGPSYTSADQPQVPADVIRRIRSDFPNDPRSPFYDISGAPMKPLAKLTIKRQRLYERLCQDENSNNIDVPRECLTHPWSSWSECTSKCGEGVQFRTRVYKEPEVAKIYNCDNFIVNRMDRTCQGNNCGSNFDKTMNSFDEDNRDQSSIFYNPHAECELTAWSPWSKCNTTCGDGVMTRRRNYMNPMSENKCQNAVNVDLYQMRTCHSRSCLGEIPESDKMSNIPANTNIDKFNRFETIPNYDSAYSNDLGNYHGPSNVETNNNFNSNVEEYLDTSKNGFEIADSNRDVESTFNHYASNNNNNEAGIFDSYNNKNQNPININRNLEDYLEVNTNVPSYCFEPLFVFTCADPSVMGNFWFYNHCENACMLYAADSCDQNKNKFRTLEMCELRCRLDDSDPFLKRKQQQGCHNYANRRRLLIP